MSKIVYNACFGGFSISEAAVIRYASLKGLTIYPEKSGKFSFANYWTVPPTHEGRVRAAKIQDDWENASMEDRQWSNKFYDDHQIGTRDFERNDPVLVQVVEELGEAANGDCASLRVCELAAGTRYRIDEYDGRESVCTPDDYDWKTA